MRLGVTEESFRMLLTDDNEVSIPVSSCVTVATHSSLAEAAVILIICWIASFKATSERSKHCL